MARRQHLGMSGIGQACARKIWYSYNWVSPEPTGPILQYGHDSEPALVKFLRGKGWVIDGEQKRVQDPKLPEFAGSLDAIGTLNNERFVIDFKTCNAKNIDTFRKQGVMKWREYYFHQLNCYMGFTGIHKAALMAFERPDDLSPVQPDTLDKHYEILEFDAVEFHRMRDRAKDIIEAYQPPAKSESFMCKFCDHVDVCQGKRLPEVNCRTCPNPCKDDEPCDKHRYNPFMLRDFFVPIQWHDDVMSMEYDTLWNGTSKDDKPAFTSEELKELFNVDDPEKFKSESLRKFVYEQD